MGYKKGRDWSESGSIGEKWRREGGSQWMGAVQVEDQSETGTGDLGVEGEDSILDHT